jgi:hypothetical protein
MPPFYESSMKIKGFVIRIDVSKAIDKNVFVKIERTASLQCEYWISFVTWVMFNGIEGFVRYGIIDEILRGEYVVDMAIDSDVDLFAAVR